MLRDSVLDLKVAILKRLLIYIILFIAIVSSIYILAMFIPGDPITVLYGEMAEDENARNVLAHQLGLDRPIYIQLLSYIINIFVGNWGKSIYTGGNVLNMVFRSYIASMKLVFLSTLLIILICYLLLYIEFVYGLNNSILNTIASLFTSIPIAIWGSIILLLFAQLKLPLIFGDIMPPLLVLTLAGLGLFYRLFKSSIEYVYRQPFILTYMMMGFSKSVIFLKALRFSLPLTLSAILYRAGLIIAGAVVIETMFLYPGMGLTFTTALSSRDYPVLIGWGIIVSATLIVINFIVDVIHAILDPRVNMQ